MSSLEHPFNSKSSGTKEAGVMSQYTSEELSYVPVAVHHRTPVLGDTKRVEDAKNLTMP